MIRLLSLVVLVLACAHTACLPYAPERALPDYCKRDFFRAGAPVTTSEREFEEERIVHSILYFYDDDDQPYAAGISDFSYDGDVATGYLFDHDGDGDHDKEAKYLYEDGLRVREEVYLLEEGRPLFSAVDIEHDDEGREQVRSHDRDGDGDHERSEHFRYDEDGNLVEISFDSGLDGEIDSIYAYVWEGGLLAREERDEGADGEIDNTLTFTYDAYGNVMREDWSDEADTYAVFGYDCWR